MDRRRVPALCFLLSGLAVAQTDYQALRAAMDASIARQRASVELMHRSVAQQREAAHRNQAQPAGGIAVSPPLSPPCDPLGEAQVAPLVETAARTQGLAPDLLQAVIAQESGFRPCAVSVAGAQGLMQLMPATAAQFEVGDPFDPQQNIDAGAKLLKSLLERYQGDLRLALGAYNAGPGRVDSYHGLPPFPETLSYVSKVLGKLVPVPSNSPTKDLSVNPSSYGITVNGDAGSASRPSPKNAP
ncbi:MAG: lytic transglycosylase domain-containing protein [Acidobacteria bacterium]|nr:lytic transglycosylase domain-containing protein [Acidobacteriota bacterium]MBI3471907.1 lytic transglycosylase domain-containing protein [Candidatus Solibacter usitatus]